MRTLIVVNGGRENPSEIAAWKVGCDFLIAVDGGAELFAKAGIDPDIVIGDFDSIKPSRLAAIDQTKIVHDPNQDTTDFQKGLLHSIERGATDIVVLDPEGDRLDHAISALGWAAAASLGRRIRFVFSRAILHLVSAEAEIKCAAGGIVSVLPIGLARVRAISGVRWPIRAATLELGVFDSVSNVSESDHVRVEIESGCVGVFIERFAGDVGW